MRYELGFYIAEDGILHSHLYENLSLTRNVLPHAEQEVTLPYAQQPA
jgi:hypothetical protein